ncbi:MAG: FkbM family methyltransferase [Bacteroidota bacterium]
MSQLIFNLLLSANHKSLYYKFLLKSRNWWLLLFPNDTIFYKYGNYTLEFPFSHDYPLNKKAIPQYSENLGVVAKVIKEKYDFCKAIDVGANIGDSAAIINNYCNMPILCIEGNPKFYTLLENNTKQMPSISIEKCFVGDTNETVSTINYGGTARLEKSTTGAEVKTFEQILDKHVDFKDTKLLKIDTDGFDNKIIRAAEHLLSYSNPIVFFEYDPFFLIKQNEIPQDIFTFLLKMNYTSLLLFDNLGRLLCQVKTENISLLKDLSIYYNQNGQSYLDICAFHSSDEDLLINIKRTFQS